MRDNRVKATISKVNKDIAPYVKTHLFGRSTIAVNDCSKVSMALLPRYNNVEIIHAVEPGKGGKPYMRITDKGTFRKEEQILIVTGKFKSKKNQYSSRHWVDDIEEYLAAMED